MSDKKRVLVLQHVKENPAGRVGTILDEYETYYHLVHVGRDHLPDPTRYDAIVVLGGAVHVYDKHRYSYTVHEEAYLHQAIKQGIPHLGMCLGDSCLPMHFKQKWRSYLKPILAFYELISLKKVEKMLSTRASRATN